MANPTTNYGFVLPTATDLVTDLPADFDVALQGVDTRLKALQPGTTAGDLFYASATANTNTRLGIGSTSQVLTVTGGVPAWATPGGGGSLTLLASGTLSGSSVNVSGLSGAYKGLKCIVRGWRPTQDGNNLEMRFNNSTTAQYQYSDPTIFGAAVAFSASDMFLLGYSGDNSVATNLGIMDVWDYANTTTWKLAQFYAINVDSTTTTSVRFSQSQNAWNQTSAITALTFGADGGTFAAGDYYIYGVN